jgi:glycosyltransferase involved in cell wall biosynthesis
MPRVSIITPTMEDRHRFLPMLWDCVRTQSVFRDVEWLIRDSSQRAATFDWIGRHVRYQHAPDEMTIGAKRNVLCAAAQGETIVHFDDDDYYGPQYIQNMLLLMTDKKVDFVKLFGFFLYQRDHDVFAYWDLESDLPWHWLLQPNAPASKARNNSHMSGPWGYGFSYVYRREVWRANHFPEVPHIPGDRRGFGEDKIFADAVPEDRKAGKQDYTPHENDFIPGSCIHVVHTNNMSVKYPQQILPRDWLPRFFPHFDPQIR